MDDVIQILIASGDRGDQHRSINMVRYLVYQDFWFCFSAVQFKIRILGVFRKLRVAFNCAFVSASSLQGQSQCMHFVDSRQMIIGKVWPVVVAVVGAGLPFVFSKNSLQKRFDFTQGTLLPFLKRVTLKKY